MPSLSFAPLDAGGAGAAVAAPAGAWLAAAGGFAAAGFVVVAFAGSALGVGPSAAVVGGGGVGRSGWSNDGGRGSSTTAGLDGAGDVVTELFGDDLNA